MRKILLVDDNSAITQELAKLLKRRGYFIASQEQIKAAE